MTASPHATRAETRSTHRERRTSQAISIVERDATLRTAFLLESIACHEEDPFTDDRASRFLLWFALEGRHRYRQASFSPAYLDFLSVPVTPYRSRLAAFVALARPEIRKRFDGDPDGFHEWYYRDGAAALGLGPFLSVRERMSHTNAQDDDMPGPAHDRWMLPGVGTS